MHGHLYWLVARFVAPGSGCVPPHSSTECQRRRQHRKLGDALQRVEELTFVAVCGKHSRCALQHFAEEPIEEPAEEEEPAAHQWGKAIPPPRAVFLSFAQQNTKSSVGLHTKRANIRDFRPRTAGCAAETNAIAAPPSHWLPRTIRRHGFVLGRSSRGVSFLYLHKSQQRRSAQIRSDPPPRKTTTNHRGADSSSCARRTFQSHITKYENATHGTHMGDAPWQPLAHTPRENKVDGRGSRDNAVQIHG
jgi:hypothetical protein